MSDSKKDWTTFSQEERFALVIQSMQYMPAPGPLAPLLEAMDNYIMGELLTEKQKQLCIQAFKPMGVV